MNYKNYKPSAIYSTVVTVILLVITILDATFDRDGWTFGWGVLSLINFVVGFVLWVKHFNSKQNNIEKL